MKGGRAASPPSSRAALLILGQVVYDIEACAWVYVGWRETSVGSIERIFVRAESGRKRSAPVWTYHAVKEATLSNKFPELAL